MEFKELIAQRRSIRRFSDRPVPREVVDRLLAEALTAPSARNTRTTCFLVVDDPALVARMADMRDYGSAFLKGAPLASSSSGRPRPATCGAKMPLFRPPCCNWPASTRGSAPAGCTSTDVRAARRLPTARRPPTTCGASCPFRPPATRHAPLPSDTPPSTPPRRPRTTIRPASSAFDLSRPSCNV